MIVSLTVCNFSFLLLNDQRRRHLELATADHGGHSEHLD